MQELRNRGLAGGWDTPAMSEAEMTEISYHLDRALAVYGRAERLLTAPEIRTKSLLSTVRAEVDRLSAATVETEARHVS